MRCRAVLFDLDGVLVNSEPSFKRHWLVWATDRGLDGEATYALGVGIRTADHIASIAPHLDAETEARRIEEAVARDASGVRACPGAPQLLDALAGLRWAIVTSSIRAFARASLDVTGLPSPPALVTGEDVSAGKPSPDGYLRAARTLDVDARDSVVIEDAPPGIEAGRAAGARVIAVSGTFPRDQLGRADAVVDTLGQLAVRRLDGTLLELVIGA